MKTWLEKFEKLPESSPPEVWLFPPPSSACSRYCWGCFSFIGLLSLDFYWIVDIALLAAVEYHNQLKQSVPLACHSPLTLESSENSWSLVLSLYEGTCWPLLCYCAFLGPSKFSKTVPFK